MITSNSRNIFVSLVIIVILIPASIMVGSELIENPPWIIILIIASIFGVYTLFKSPSVFLSLYFAAAILFRSFVRIRIGPVYITEAVLFLLLAQSFASGRYRAAVKNLSANRRIVYPMLLFFFVGLLSLVRGYENGLTALRDSVIIFYCILALLVPSVIQSRSDLSKLCKWMIFTGIVLNVLLFIKLLTEGFGISEMAAPRLFGARTSAFLVFVGFLAVSGEFGKNPRRKKWLRYFGIAQFCMVILLSGTRNVWIASFVTFIFWMIFVKNSSLSMKSIFRYAIFSGIFVIGVISLSRTQYTGDSMADSFRRSATSIVDYESSANALERVSWWKEAFVITATGNPFIGKPFGSMTLFAEFDTKYNSIMKMAFHNSYVTILYYTGFIGLLLIGVIIFRVLEKGVIFSRSSRLVNTHNLGIAITLSICFYCTVSFFNVILEAPQSAMIFWLLLGLLFVISDYSKQKTIPPE